MIEPPSTHLAPNQLTSEIQQKTEENNTKTVKPQGEVDPDGHFFLDGSGGEYSKDPRLRVCGWAWVQPAQSATYPAWPIAGQYGTSPGKQTVPRAEMRALLQLLRKLEEEGHEDFNERVP